MRNAHNAALLAIMAEAERREQEDKTARAGAPAWESVKRPIALDLAQLAKNMRKGRA